MRLILYYRKYLYCTKFFKKLKELYPFLSLLKLLKRTFNTENSLIIFAECYGIPSFTFWANSSCYKSSKIRHFACLQGHLLHWLCLGIDQTIFWKILLPDKQACPCRRRHFQRITLPSMLYFLYFCRIAWYFWVYLIKLQLPLTSC